jgi:hypothetical protein
METVPRMPKTAVKAILALRPFRGFEDLVSQQGLRHTFWPAAPTASSC